MTILEFLDDSISESITLESQVEFLRNTQVDDPKQLAEVVRFLQHHMPETPKLDNAIDICGTGGSGLTRLNTSTITAFLLASLGVHIAKHGNNAASGRFGSFDLLEALGVPINLSNQELQARFNKYNLAFLYAKHFHPSMRFFGPARAAVGKPTFFNILGPLLSPVNAKRQIIGVSKPEHLKLIAETARELGKERVMVVHGCDGLDDITLSGESSVVELNNGKISEYTLTPNDFGINPINNFDEIAGGDNTRNIELAVELLKGDRHSRHEDLVLVNTALAMKLAGKSDDLKANFAKAKEQLDSGAAYQLLQDYKQPTIMREIVEQNEQNLPTTSKPDSRKVRIYRGGLIAEIKHASPSEGEFSSKFDVRARAKMYESGGAKAISIVVEPRFFKGNYDDIKTAREATSLPILCKDFITRKEQIYHAAEAGADIVLLIVAILNKGTLHELKQIAEELGLQVLVETHTQNELDMAVEVSTGLIGINRRNLHDFSIDYQLFDKLDIPDGVTVIAESGIETFQQIPKRADGWLVGTILMKNPFPKLNLKELGLNKPLLKLCGIRKVEDAELCEDLGVDMIGLNFVQRSKRKVSVELAKDIRQNCNNTLVIGIFEDSSKEEVDSIAEAVGLDAVQLPITCEFTNQLDIPVVQVAPFDYTNKNIDSSTRPKQTALTIVDNKRGGSGKTFDYKKYIWKNYGSLIAGGVDLETAKMLLKDYQPLGIDTASGIETDGIVDQSKIRDFVKLFEETTYEN